MTNGEASASDFEEFLTFCLGEQEFGVHIQQVQGIQGWDKVTEIPETPPHVLGVIDLRGTVVPIIDLRRRLGFSQCEFNATTVVIVVSVGDDDTGNTYGLVVDAVSEVCDVPAAERKSSPNFGGGIKAEYMLGLATLDERMIILLDLNRLVNDTDFDFNVDVDVDVEELSDEDEVSAEIDASAVEAEPSPDVEAIEESFALLAPQADALADRFYDELFLRYPDVKPMFANTQMSEQKRKLIAAVQLVVNNVRKPEALSEPLAALGARHQALGAELPHYEAVAQTMLKVLEELAGDAWNERYAKAWVQALELVATGMLAGYTDEIIAAGSAA
jgi:purine-binding chemotaxis protein CheW